MRDKIYKGRIQKSRVPYFAVLIFNIKAVFMVIKNEHFFFK